MTNQIFKNCTKCGSPDDHVYWRVTSDNVPYVFCRACHTGTNTCVPDVWYGYGSGIHTEENICDPQTGKPIPFYDKQSKAAAMKIAGVREAGDRKHGMRNEDSLKRRTYFTQ